MQTYESKTLKQPSVRRFDVSSLFYDETVDLPGLNEQFYCSIFLSKAFGNFFHIACSMGLIHESSND